MRGKGLGTKEQFRNCKNFLSRLATRLVSKSGYAASIAVSKDHWPIVHVDLIWQVFMVILTLSFQICKNGGRGFPASAFSALAAMTAVVKENFCK